MLNFYNYYLNSYSTVRSTSRFDTHKRTELKQVCKSIAKLNLQSPLCIIKLSDEVQQYAIDLKENSRQLKNVITSIKEGEDKNTSKMFTQKEIVSSDSDKVSVKYIGSAEDLSSAVPLDITVSDLASPQINRGRYVYSKSTSLSHGDYSIDITVGNSSYEFQFSAGKNDTNSSIINKFCSSINKADIGILCSNETDPDNPERQRIVIASTITGMPDYSNTLFSIVDSGDTDVSDTFGLNNMYSQSSNSHFTINGVSRTSSSNTFTVNKMYEITLEAVTAEDSPVTVFSKSNKDLISNKLHEFVDSYDNIINFTKNTSKIAKSSKLLADIGSIAHCYSSELDSMGLNVNDDSSITINNEVLNDYIDSEENADGTYASFRSFRNPLERKLDNVIYNPMDYVAKTIVAYPNTKNSLPNIYATSMYSGLMFNNYC